MTIKIAGQPGRVLVIDDNRMLCEFISETLKLYSNYSVDYLTSTHSLAENIKPDTEMIFLDLCIPEHDGIEVIQLLAQYGCQAELVLMSGSGEDMLICASKLAEQYNLKVRATLTKPFGVDDIMDNLMMQKNSATVRAMRA